MSNSFALLYAFMQSSNVYACVCMCLCTMRDSMAWRGVCQYKCKASQRRRRHKDKRRQEAQMCGRRRGGRGGQKNRASISLASPPVKNSFEVLAKASSMPPLPLGLSRLSDCRSRFQPLCVCCVCTCAVCVCVLCVCVLVCLCIETSSSLSSPKITNPQKTPGHTSNKQINMLKILVYSHSRPDYGSSDPRAKTKSSQSSTRRRSSSSRAGSSDSDSGAF